MRSMIAAFESDFKCQGHAVCESQDRHGCPEESNRGEFH